MSCQDDFEPPRITPDPAGPGGDDVVLQVNLRLQLDQVAEKEAEELRAGARRQPSEKELRRLARKIYEARRLRDRMMDEKLFGEPAWDMLLALYHLPAMGKLLTVSGLCYCAGTPPTTALRWQKVLLSERLIERVSHPKDQRTQFVHLSRHGRTLLEQYLTRLFYSERSGPLVSGMCAEPSTPEM